MIDRRGVLAAAVGSAGALVAWRPRAARGALPLLLQPAHDEAASIVWHDAASIGVEGKGWAQTERYFDRLPLKAKDVVPAPVWELSRKSAGISLSFETDAREVHVRYTLMSKSLAGANQTAIGASGLDLYAHDATRWRWASCFRPTGIENAGKLIENVDPMPGNASRRFRVYLPYHNGVEALALGVPSGAKFTPIPPRTGKPVVVYGTSIVHGSSASRPGMTWPAILGRTLDMPTLNLGFSGNGRMELALGELLSEIDAAAYVIDCAPNMTPEQISERCVPLVELLRKTSTAPIILIEDRRYGNGWVRASSRERNSRNAQALRAAHSALLEKGVANLKYIDADRLQGTDPEETMTDGSHPSDWGMKLHADVVAAELRSIL